MTFTLLRRAAAQLVLAGCALMLLAAPARAQEPPSKPPAAAPVRVFIDCQSVSCDYEYFRTEIAFVDHVRDRKDADVHVLITGQTTGSGGQEVLAEIHRPRPLPERGRGDGLRRVGRRDERPGSQGPRPAPDAGPGPLRGRVPGRAEAHREVHAGNGQSRGPGSPGRPRPLGLLGLPPLRQRLLQRRGIDLEQVVLRIRIRQPDDGSLEDRHLVQRQL